MKMSRIKKRVAAMMMVSVLSLWFALPDVAHAQTVTVEGRTVHTYLTVSSISATATISYSEGPGQVKARVTGHARSILAHNVTASARGPENSNPTPGGVNSSVDAPDGWRFESASSWCKYEVYINDIKYEGNISDSLDL